MCVCVGGGSGFVFVAIFLPEISKNDQGENQASDGDGNTDDSQIMKSVLMLLWYFNLDMGKGFIKKTSNPFFIYKTKSYYIFNKTALA